MCIYCSNGSAPSVPRKASLRQDLWNLVQQLHPEERQIAVDVSQSARRIPLRLNGQIPVVTPGAKIILQQQASEDGKMWRHHMTGLDKMLASEAPLEKFVQKFSGTTTERQLARWGGNTMSLRCMSVSWMLGILLVDWRKACQYDCKMSSPAQFFEVRKMHELSFWRCRAMSEDAPETQVVHEHVMEEDNQGLTETLPDSPAMPLPDGLEGRASLLKPGKSSGQKSAQAWQEPRQRQKRCLEETLSNFSWPEDHGKKMRQPTILERLEALEAQYFPETQPYRLEKLIAH